MEEPLVQVRKEPSFNGHSVERLCAMSPVNEGQSLPNLDIDPVDLMFLHFARRFKTFSGIRQFHLRSGFFEMMAEAEMEEISESGK